MNDTWIKLKEWNKQKKNQIKMHLKKKKKYIYKRCNDYALFSFIKNETYVYSRLK